MYGDVEQLVLSGALFNGASRSSSPARSPSPGNEKEADWPPKSEAKFGDGYDYEEYDSDSERLARIPNLKQETDGVGSIGMKPGRTGVKGVIRDRNEAKDLERAQRAQDMRELNKRMEKANLGGKTFSEEEKEKEWEKMMLEGLANAVTIDRSQLDTWRGRKKIFGHLREVGVRGFVAAVEQEAKGVWVVVHLYDPSLDRCYDLDTNLSRLARLNPDTKFVRTRAGALGFASLHHAHTFPSRSTLSSARQSKSSRIRYATIDEDDPYDYPADENEDENDGEDGEEDGSAREDEDDVDLDMLPTMLVYRDGELVHNWVRVDWEAGQTSIEELLSKHHILEGARGNCGLPSDDEDDLFDDGDDLEFESGI